MAVDLPGTGTISYNGITFAGPRVQTYVEIDPEWDDARRVIISDVMTIYVNAIITSDENGLAGPSSASDDTDSYIPKIQRLLQQSGGQLQYAGVGHGSTFIINSTPTNRDVNWGPRPGKLTIKPIGNNLVHELTWSVSVSIKRCNAETNALYGRIGDIRSMNYSVKYNIDGVTGLTTRTIEGYILISLNRNGAGFNTYSVSADEYRHRFQVDVPVYFRRKSSQWNVNSAKDRVSFVIVDEEMETEFGMPYGVADLDFDCTTTLDILRKSEKPLYGRINGSFKMVRLYPVSDGWNRILGMVRERINRIRSNGIKVYINKFSVTDKVMRRGGSFDIQFLLIAPQNADGTTGWEKLVKNTALFETPTSISYPSWVGSMKNSAWHERGLARLGVDASNDRLVDSCNPMGTVQIRDPFVFSPTRGLGDGLGSDIPTPDTSYLYYENSIKAFSDSKEMVHTLMGSNTTVGAGVGLHFISDFAKSLNTTPQGAVVQLSGQSLLYVRLKGRALRLRYDPELPKLRRFFNQKATYVRTKDDTDYTIVSYSGPYPIIRLSWDHLYVVPFNSPAEVEAALSQGLGSAVIATESDPTGGKVRN